jgi:hypothetical protein
MAPAALPAASLPPSTGADVTVIVNFKGPYSEAAVKTMRRETEQILKSSGVSLEWRSRAEAGDLSFNDLVVVSFKGSCQFNPAPLVVDELGPYAVTRITGGEVQPFGEVDCDHIVSSIRGAMNGEDLARADMLLGRALGRVVAHELVHMLTKSTHHGKEGVEKSSLTARQLIAESLPLSAMDVNRLLERRAH